MRNTRSEELVLKGTRGTNEYPSIDKQFKKKCNEEYTKFLEEKCEEIEEKLLVNPAEAHKRIKEL